jgi:hypothetical protein
MQYNLRARYYDLINGRFKQVNPFAGNNKDPIKIETYA